MPRKLHTYRKLGRHEFATITHTTKFQAKLQQQFCNLYRIQRSAFADLISTDKHVQATAVFLAVIRPDTTDIYIILS